MKVIILAGGKGTRLPKSAKNIPKSLVEIGGKPLLQHQIDLLQKHGLTDIRLSLGYRAEKIIEYLKKQDLDIVLERVMRPSGHGPRPKRRGSEAESLSPARWAGRGKRKDNIQILNIEYTVEPEPLGTGGAIKFASKDLKKDFMVLNGDILTDINLSKFISKYQYNNNVSRQTLGAIGLFYCEDTSDYGLVKIKKERILNFLEKPKEKCSGYINAGIYILSPTIFCNVKKTSFSIEKDIFPKLSKKRQLIAYIHQGFWTDLGTEERLRETKRRFRAM